MIVNSYPTAHDIRDTVRSLFDEVDGQLVIEDVHPEYIRGAAELAARLLVRDRYADADQLILSVAEFLGLETVTGVV